MSGRIVKPQKTCLGQYPTWCSNRVPPKYQRRYSFSQL